MNQITCQLFARYSIIKIDIAGLFVKKLINIKIVSQKILTRQSVSQKKGKKLIRWHKKHRNY